MKCKRCGAENGDCKRTCGTCGAFLEGYTPNNVTGVDDINVREKMTVPQLPLPPELDIEKNIGKYNGGLTGIDFGPITMPLPYPDEGKKWALEWHDTPSGEILPEIVQVGLEAEISAMREGYPKYDK